MIATDTLRKSWYLFLIAALSCFLLGTARSRGEPHSHPIADGPLHEQFYSTWFMPDQPTKSCCNKADCYPTIVKFEDGHWLARRRDDGKFIAIPWNKVERNRDNPDGRSHVCMPSLIAAQSYPQGTVFCFSLGGGI